MSARNNGGTAFPCEQGFEPSGQWNQSFEPGMSLRDYFAAAALQGMLASEDPNEVVTLPTYAADAYRLADAMLEVRSK